MSPEIPAIIVLKGLLSAKLPLTDIFTLHDTDRRSWDIQHSRSLSREDIPKSGPDLPPAETSRFHDRPWQVALHVMKECGENINATCFGKARAARVRDGNVHNPEIKYDVSAAGHGAVEAARMMLAMGNRQGANLEFLRSMFEHERLPRNLGWKPTPFAGPIEEMLDVALETQQVDKILRCTSNGRVATRVVSHISSSLGKPALTRLGYHSIICWRHPSIQRDRKGACQEGWVQQAVHLRGPG